MQPRWRRKTFKVERNRETSKGCIYEIGRSRDREVQIVASLFPLAPNPIYFYVGCTYDFDQCLLGRQAVDQTADSHKRYSGPSASPNSATTNISNIILLIAWSPKKTIPHPHSFALNSALPPLPLLFAQPDLNICDCHSIYIVIGSIDLYVLSFLSFKY